MEQHYDAIIVGGGIGGGALATVLARSGHSVLVLERSTIYPDRVRGEWIAPWGVLELKRLGLYDTLMHHGGHHLRRHATLGEDVDDPDAAIANALDMTTLLPGAPGPLCIRHPVACQALVDTAEDAGATVLRGVSTVTVSPGDAPAVTFEHDGQQHTIRTTLIVGADGRAGATRAQAGIPLHHDPPHNLFSGLLVKDAGDWPDDLQTKGTEGDFNFLAFPQGGGLVRLYLGYSYERKDFLAGEGAEQRFLDAFRLRSVPGSDALANATPISECHSYPNHDTWTDEPFVEGLVLIGDAAGHNDPILGQGLSITLRDVRIVAEALQACDDWANVDFQPYAEERAERMRRLRNACRLQAALDAEFGPEARERRRRYRQRAATDPRASLPTAATMVGPENIPEFAFEDAFIDSLLERGEPAGS